MSALVLVEEFPEDINIIISESAISLNQNRYNLSPGDIISKQEALDFILIPSSNIVAHSVAASLGENKFIQLMNRKAMNLGLNDTIFIDPSGISNFTSSTAQDIVKLLRYISENHPEILAISRTPQFEFKKGTSKASIVYNTNELLGTFPGIIGGKTGYTLEARGCLALVFEVGGRKFFAVVLGSSDRFGDMKKIIEYAKKI
jgi:D-alanyl-D-alanine carboxypeptidase (penicillin-binding protein 5/6)